MKSNAIIRIEDIWYQVPIYWFQVLFAFKVLFFCSLESVHAGMLTAPHRNTQGEHKSIKVILFTHESVYLRMIVLEVVAEARVFLNFYLFAKGQSIDACA